MAGISGAGAEVTALAESLQAYACAARQFKGKDLEHIGEVNAKTTKDAKCDRPLNRCLAELDTGWMHSVIVTANLLFKDFQIKSGYEFHRGGKVVEDVYGEFRRFKKQSGLTGEDKWNPADIWVLKKGYKVKTGFGSLKEVNAYIYEEFKAKKLIGVSLKKIPKGEAHSKIFNDGKPPKAKFKEVKKMTDVTASKDIYWTLQFDNTSVNVQLRNFSSRPVTSSWQGEIKGKSAAGGKIGGGILIQAATEGGVSKSSLMLPSAFSQYIEKPNKQIITKFAEMYKFISGTNETLKSIIDKTTTYSRADPTWWMSKYLGVHYTYSVIKSGKQDSVAGWIYGYASSATKNSSIFIKYSD